MIEAQANAATYAWICTEDHITDPEDDLPSRKGWEGPSTAPEYLLERLRKGEGHKWRCYDDDGELYYAGLFLDTEDDTPPTKSDKYNCISNMTEEAFGPLWDFAQPDAGAVTIKYKVGNEWLIL
jgi:hypothetical protein